MVQAKLSSQAAAVSPAPAASSKGVFDSGATPMTEEERSKRQAFLAKYNYESAEEDGESYPFLRFLCVGVVF